MGDVSKQLDHALGTMDESLSWKDVPDVEKARRRLPPGMMVRRKNGIYRRTNTGWIRISKADAKDSDALRTFNEWLADKNRQHDDNKILDIKTLEQSFPYEPDGKDLYKAHQPNPPWPGAVFDETSHRWEVPEVQDYSFKPGDIVPYMPTFDKRIKNIASLPRGTGAKYLVVIPGEGSDLVAKRWSREKPKLVGGEFAFVFGNKKKKVQEISFGQIKGDKQKIIGGAINKLAKRGLKSSVTKFDIDPTLKETTKGKYYGQSNTIKFRHNDYITPFLAEHELLHGILTDFGNLDFLVNYAKISGYTGKGLYKNIRQEATVRIPIMEALVREFQGYLHDPSGSDKKQFFEQLENDLIQSHICKSYQDTLQLYVKSGSLVKSINDGITTSITKAVVPTPMNDKGHFDHKKVATGDSVWITVGDPSSPMHGRHVLITKRPDGLFAITAGGGPKDKDDTIAARRHMVLTGTPHRSQRDTELEQEREAAIDSNEPILAAKKEMEEQARGEVREAAANMLTALGIGKQDKDQVAQQRDKVQAYVAQTVEDPQQAKRITDTIVRQLAAADKKVKDHVQRERALAVAKVGKRLASLGDGEIIRHTIEPFAIQLPSVNILLGENDETTISSVIANAIGDQVNNHLGENNESGISSVDGENAADKTINPLGESNGNTVMLGEDIEPLELKDKEALTKAIGAVQGYYDKRHQAEMQREAIRRVPLAQASPATIASTVDTIKAQGFAMSAEDLEQKTQQDYDYWMRTNTALALYDIAGEHWNDKKSLVDTLNDSGKTDTTMKYHLDNGAAVALASLAKEHLGTTVDVGRLIKDTNIETAAAMVAYKVRQSVGSKGEYEAAIKAVKAHNATNQEATEKRALTRHKMLKTQYDEIQRQKANAELVDKVRISSLETANLLEQRKNIGAAIGSLQASATFFDQLEKLHPDKAKDDIIHINVGSELADAEALVDRLGLSHRKHQQYHIDVSDPDNIQVQLGLSSLGGRITEQDDNAAIHDKYEQIKTATTNATLDSKGNWQVGGYAVPGWKTTYIDGENGEKPYNWRLEQRNDIEWLREVTKPTGDNPDGEGGGLITRVTGAGKTNTALGFFGHKIAADPSYKGLVVVPKGRAEQWGQEAAKYSDLKVNVIPDGTSKEQVERMLLESAPGGVYVMGHREAAKNSEMLGQLQTHDKTKFHGFVIDEPQELQARGQSGNMGALGKRIMQLPVKHRIALTATPARKSPTEVYDLIKWTNPAGAKQLGSKASFNRIYSGFGSGTNAQDAAIGKMYFDAIKPYISGDRITNPDFKVHDTDTAITRTDSQIQQQKKLEAEADTFTKQRKAEIMQEVRDNANHPLRRSATWEATLPRKAGEQARKELETKHYANMDNGDHTANSKMLALRKNLEAQPDSKHVMYIDSRMQRNTLNAMLADMGVKPSMVKNLASSTTEISGEEMAARAEAFRKDKGVKYLLLDKNSSSGYNLQEGDYLHVLGSFPDAATYMQAQGRLARMPRKGDVHIVKYKYDDNPTEQARYNDLDSQLKLLKVSAPGLFVGRD